MTIDSLDTPLRVTWDLCTPETFAPVDVAQKLTERLIEAQAFYVTLERTPLLHPSFETVATSLCAAGCQLLVVSRGSVAEMKSLSTFPNGASLLLEVDALLPSEGGCLDQLDAVCQALRHSGVNFGLSMIPTRQQLKWVGPLIRFCLDRDVPRFKLPNMRINDNFSTGIRSWLVRPQDVELFRQQAADFPDFREKLQLDVHDLFLWEILFPDGGVARSEYGGCQAANSLAHIDLNGIVHPCVSWPQPLGSLLDNSFYDLWQGPDRLNVRAEIASVPSGCEGCRDYSLCFGGCRGLSRLDADFMGRDPMCKGTR